MLSEVLVSSKWEASKGQTNLLGFLKNGIKKKINEIKIFRLVSACNWVMPKSQMREESQELAVFHDCLFLCVWMCLKAYGSLVCSSQSADSCQRCPQKVLTDLNSICLFLDILLF